MPLYQCNKCKYTTMYKSNFNRHNKSSTHLKKCKTTANKTKFKCKYCKKYFTRQYSLNRHNKTIHFNQLEYNNNASDVVQNVNNTSIQSTSKIHQINLKNNELFNNQSTDCKKNACYYCKNIYSRVSSLTRHQKICPVKKVHENAEKVEFKKATNEKEIHFLKEHIKILEKQNKQYQQEKKFYQSIVQQSGTALKKSMSALVYIATNYLNAPPINKLTIEMIDDLDNDEYNLGSTMIYHYNIKTLGTFLGEYIVNVYKKEDPKTQSIWNTDCTRFTYMIKDIFKDENSNWIVDKKGVRTIEITIKPLMVFTENIIQKTQKIACSKLPTIKGETDRTILMDLIKSASYLIADIKDNTLEKEVLKHISPYLHLGFKP